MEFAGIDVIVFVGFIGAVIGIGIFKSRNEKTSEDYFLAGRGLSWWLIGFSLIAANISTEQFIGMSGQAANWLGLAIASYEWMAAITLVVVAFVFLPRLLRSGIYTIPEYLEYRYNEWARALMALFMIGTVVMVTFSVVVLSGAIVVDTLFGGKSVLGIEINITTSCWTIGLLAAVYVACGGLKACAWADLLQGSALIVGGAIVLWLAMKALGAATPETIPALANIDPSLGAYGRFKALNADKLHMVMPRTDPAIPWTALIVGLWIPNFYYWGLNQYIMQRTLGAKSLAEGQKGVVFAAALKLIIPFIIVFPGIMAFNLYSDEMKEEAGGSNEVVLAKFEEVKGNPASANTVFNFDDEFAGMYQDQAKAMIALNSAVLGQPAPDTSSLTEGEALVAVRGEALVAAKGKPLVAANAALLDANKARPDDQQVEEQKQLIGYKYDSAFALLIRELVPKGLRGFIMAAILGAVMSSLASMLNSASTIFTMDIYNKYINKGASQRGLVTVGRICVGVFAVIGCFIAPILDDPKFGGVFHFIQEFQGYISPGILAVFVFGIVVKTAPSFSGVAGLILNPIVYFVLARALPGMAFLDRMALCFFCVLGLMGILTLIWRAEPKVLPKNTDIELESSGVAKACGIAVVAATLVLYAVFW